MFLAQHILYNIPIYKVVPFILSNNPLLKISVHYVPFNTTKIIGQGLPLKYVSIIRNQYPPQLKKHLVLQINETSLFRNQMFFFIKHLIMNTEVSLNFMSECDFRLPTVFKSLEQMIALNFFKTNFICDCLITNFDARSTMQDYNRQFSFNQTKWKIFRAFMKKIHPYNHNYYKQFGLN
ncbi:uncharacterized protein ASCRUDRAFT_7718 [Ascoidea rubescens DSM 1968]|uniref:Uncharacterized protein n=1 Tax=Ascoidea rubescens DSM 1968 TaxID=1344418 RepID=A0A1D2VIM9_9ASCO|nr:hypothetical protein ASCRUDRAFT_7718 [Ascoidea rubescens DSM 1968]ODV61494.1 hypothetical protein ASCRUDRAFT_7718 [Ascoidea rubescens DSM 1968]